MTITSVVTLVAVCFICRLPGPGYEGLNKTGLADFTCHHLVKTNSNIVPS
jgi:hypothetical protein